MKLTIILPGLLLLSGLSALGQEDWVQVGEIPSEELQSVYVAGSTLYAGGVAVVYRSENNGPFEASNPLPDTADAVSAIIAAGGHLYAGTYGLGVFESVDGGENWTAVNSGLNGLGAQAIAAFAVRGDSLYVGTIGAGVFVARLTGPISWQPYRDGMPSNYAWSVFSLDVLDDMLICGSGASAFVYRRFPGAATWEEIQFAPMIPLGLEMYDVAGRDGVLYGIGADGLYRSLDSGLTWEQTLSTVGLYGDGSIVFTPTRILAVTFRISSGTYLYEFTEGSWQLLRHFPGVVTMEATYYSGRLYAARFDGLWYLPLAPTAVENPEETLPAQFSLAQNYPNPFNPGTTIEYRLGTRSAVSLAIYDMLGRLVWQYDPGVQASGTYRVAWDGRSISGHEVGSGIYLYRLTAGSQVGSRKMVLIR